MRNFIFFILAVFLFSSCGSTDPAENQIIEPPIEQPSQPNLTEVQDTLNNSTDSLTNLAIKDSLNTQVAETPTSKTTKNIPEPTPVTTSNNTTTNNTPTSQPVKHTPKAPKAVIQFVTKAFDYGTIKEGESIDRVFKFKNVGNVPLNLLSVEATCGCTQPTFPFLPIPPGGENEIKVTFNSRLKRGKQNSKITVLTDASVKTHYLYLNGFVEEKPKEEEKEEKDDPKEEKENPDKEEEKEEPKAPEEPKKEVPTSQPTDSTGNQ